MQCSADMRAFLSPCSGRDSSRPAGDLQRLTADASQLAARIQRADVAHHAASILERLRGAALGTTSQTQPVLFAMFAGLLQPLLVVQAAARKHEGLTVLVIKLAADFVESQISYLTVRRPTVQTCPLPQMEERRMERSAACHNPCAYSTLLYKHEGLLAAACCVWAHVIPLEVKPCDVQA